MTICSCSSSSGAPSSFEVATPWLFVVTPAASRPTSDTVFWPASFAIWTVRGFSVFSGPHTSKSDMSVTTPILRSSTSAFETFASESENDTCTSGLNVPLLLLVVVVKIVEFVGLSPTFTSIVLLSFCACVTAAAIVEAGWPLDVGGGTTSTVLFFSTLGVLTVICCFSSLLTDFTSALGSTGFGLFGSPPGRKE